VANFLEFVVDVKNHFNPQEDPVGFVINVVKMEKETNG
jgi:hypothetical protein